MFFSANTFNFVYLYGFVVTLGVQHYPLNISHVLIKIGEGGGLIINAQSSHLNIDWEDLVVTSVSFYPHFLGVSRLFHLKHMVERGNLLWINNDSLDNAKNRGEDMYWLWAMVFLTACLSKDFCVS